MKETKGKSVVGAGVQTSPPAMDRGGGVLAAAAACKANSILLQDEGDITCSLLRGFAVRGWTQRVKLALEGCDSTAATGGTLAS